MKETPRYMLITKSQNQKTGKMAISTSPKETCPQSCPFKCNGCYAASGPLNLWWNRCTDNKNDPEIEWQKFINAVAALPKGTIFRHNQAGDLAGTSPIEIDSKKAVELLKAAKRAGVNGYTYTHYPVVRGHTSNRGIVELMNNSGFTVNISANSPAHADAIVDSGIQAPVCTLLSADVKGKTVKSPGGRTIVVCPAIHNKEIKCEKCKACMNHKRKVIIGFPAHGSNKKKCEAVIEEYNKIYGFNERVSGLKSWDVEPDEKTQKEILKNGFVGL